MIAIFLDIGVTVSKDIHNTNYHPEVAATAVKSVDRTTVNYLQPFTYTINVSFNGLGEYGPITDAYLIDVIPNYIKIVQLPPKGGIIKDVTTTTLPDGSTKIKIDFGAINNLGVAYVFELKCQYLLIAPNNQSFANHIDVTVIQNITHIISADATPVTLVLVPKYTLTKSRTLPFIEPGPGSRLVYTLNVKNIGDGGYCVDSLILTDALPNGLTIDTAIPITGKDASPAPFQYNLCDQTFSYTTGQPLVFNVTSSHPYCGTNYIITIPTIVSDTVPIYSTLDNVVDWSIDGVEQSPAELITNVINPLFSSSISKNGPTYATKVEPDNLISYGLSFQNNGNQDLTNVTVIDTVPVEVTPYRLYTGSYAIGSINYPYTSTLTIAYSTDNQINWSNLTTITLPASGSWISLSPPNKITDIRWAFSNWPSGISTSSSPKIDGVIDSNTASASILNTAKINWTGGSNSSSKLTYLNGAASLSLTKNRIGTNAAVIPGNIIKYRLSFNSNNSTINNAVLTDLLPPQVTLVPPSGTPDPTNYTVTTTYFNYFNGSGGSSKTLTYKVTQQPDPNGTGRILVTFTITDPQIFQQNSSVNIDFNVMVNIGAVGTISNQGTLNSSNNITPSQPAQSNIINTPISFNNSIASDKGVKGALDSDYSTYPEKGQTYDGGTLLYKLTLENTGNLNLQELEVVDIFPHPGDTGVILTDDPRGSEFQIFLTHNPNITVTSTDPNLPIPTVTVEYSNSYDPVRFGPTNNIIGTVDDWTTVAPYPISNVKSIKLSIGNTSLKPGQSIIVIIEAQVPVGLPAEDPPLVAWNSFALKGSYINQYGVLTSFLPVEPEKVGMTVNQPIYYGKIGSFTWHDYNEDTVYDPTYDIGINNVIVQLYDVNPITNPSAVPIRTITTNNDNNGKPGYYLFNNLPTSKTGISYYVKFIPPLGFDFTLQNLDEPNGSKPNPYTGIAPVVILTDDKPEVLDVNAGLLDRICSTNHVEECLYNLSMPDIIQSINTSDSYLYVTVTDSFLDKSKIIFELYEGSIVPGYNIYVTSYINYSFYYNNNEYYEFIAPHYSVLFVPLYAVDNTFTISSTIENTKFYISGSRRTFLVEYDLEVCLYFEKVNS